MNATYIIIGVAAVVVLFIIVWVKISIDEKKGENSGEKQKVKDIVKKAVPNGESYTAAYGTRETLALGGGGRTVRSHLNREICIWFRFLLTAAISVMESRFIMEKKTSAWQRRKTVI